MSRTSRISRRTVLRGLGLAVALPCLDAMESCSVRGGPAQAAPRRLAVVYVPNGIDMPGWTPETTGSDYAMPAILEPLVPLRQDLLILSGLAAHRADGPSGNHARALAVFLTGRRPPDSGGEIQLGTSADQLAARVAGRHTRLPSLELGCEPGAQSGQCDRPYSCAYTSNISWRSETTPAPPEVNPRLVFERLFSTPARDQAESQARRLSQRKSILDLVREEAVQLQSRLNGNDRNKLDEYLTAVREVEVRIERGEKASPDSPSYPRPTGIPADHGEHIRMQCDLLALAFQTDVTRVATFLFANEFSNRPYPSIDVRDGHHDLSHHGKDPEKIAKIRKINRFHVEQFAYLLRKLKGIREEEGTLLDSCLIAYGSGNSDGNRHNHDNLPILLAGKGGGTVKPGRHIRLADSTPLTNLWLSLLERMGVSVNSFGDSTGRLAALTG